MLSLVASLLLVVSNSPMTIPPQLKDVNRIVMMGDSITQMGASPKGYVTLVSDTLADRLGKGKIEILNMGIGGQKSTDMHARFKRDVLDHHPQIATLSVGVNDVWHDFRNPEWTARVPSGDSGRGVKIDRYKAEVEAMVTEAQAAGIRIILLSPSLIYEDLDCDENKRLSAYVRAEREIAARHGAGFVNLNAAFRDVVAAYQKHAGKRTLLLTVDGVHLNDAGNALMADLVLHALGVPAEDRLSPR